MKSVDDYKNNKESRDKVFRGATKGLADEMRKLQEKEDENNREDQLKETVNKLAGYMKELEKK